MVTGDGLSLVGFHCCGFGVTMVGLGFDLVFLIGWQMGGFWWV